MILTPETARFRLGFGGPTTELAAPEAIEAATEQALASVRDARREPFHEPRLAGSHVHTLYLLRKNALAVFGEPPPCTAHRRAGAGNDPPGHRRFPSAIVSGRVAAELEIH